jgi:predicted ATP-dependent protease
VILPKQNEKNVKEDLGEELMKGLTIHLVNTIDEVLLLALVHETDRPRKRTPKHGKPAPAHRGDRRSGPVR